MTIPKIGPKTTGLNHPRPAILQLSRNFLRRTYRGESVKPLKLCSTSVGCLSKSLSRWHFPRSHVHVKLGFLEIGNDSTLKLTQKRHETPCMRLSKQKKQPFLDTTIRSPLLVMSLSRLSSLNLPLLRLKTLSTSQLTWTTMGKGH